MNIQAVTVLKYAAVPIIAVVTLVIVFNFQNNSADTATNDLERLSAIALSDYAGRTVSLLEYRGKSLVVNSWAVWCPFCRQELPDFAALQKAFPEITVMAIDRQESLEKAKGYTDELGISEKMVFLLDPDDSFYTLIGGFSMPETIFVDKSGTIVFHKRGPLTLDEMKTAVGQYLQ